MENDGGAAFPEQQVKQDILGGATLGTRTPGMTLRDYFAAKAMQGMFAASIGLHMSDVARNAYKAADYMIAERSK